MDNIQAMEAELLAEALLEMGPINEVLEIDAESRTINVPSNELIFGVVTDQDVERKYFLCPKIVGDNVDLSLLSLRVHFENAKGEKDKYIVDDVQVDNDHVTFSWLLSEKVLRYNGSVNFTICAVSVDADGTLKNKWNTTLATGNVLNGLEVDDLTEEEETETRDVLQQLLNLLNVQTEETIQNVKDEGSNQIANVKAEAATQIAAVEEKGVATLATIPEDYTEMSKQVESNTRYSAPVIVQSSEGESIVVKDSAKMPVLGLNVFGKSSQRTTVGKQLFDCSTLNGSQYTVEDNCITVLATDGAAWSNIISSAHVTPGTYHISSDNDFGRLEIKDSDDVLLLTKDSGTTASFTIDYEADIKIKFCCSIKTYPYYLGRVMLSSDPDAEWEPYTGGIPSPNPAYPQEIVSIENSTINVFGQNLLDVYKYVEDGYTNTLNGLTVEIHNGIAHVYGTNENTTGYSVPYTVEIRVDERTMFPPGTYSSHPGLTVSFYNSKANPQWKNRAGTFTLDEPHELKGFYIAVDPGATVDNYVALTLVPGSKIPSVNDYIKQETIQSINSKVTLPGLPVTSGGNYTDSNGQQYICDYRDWERGVDVQMITSITVNGDSPIHKNTADVNNYLYYMYVTKVACKKGIDACLCDRLGVRGIYDIIDGKSEGVCGINFNSTSSILYFNVGYYLSENTVESVKALLNEKPLCFIYVRETPIETPIPEAELQAYRELHTNYPNTTILNDSGVHMKLTYATDTKTYIDNKILEMINS